MVQHKIEANALTLNNSFQFCNIATVEAVVTINYYIADTIRKFFKMQEKLKFMIIQLDIKMCLKYTFQLMTTSFLPLVCTIVPCHNIWYDHFSDILIMLNTIQ